MKGPGLTVLTIYNTTTGEILSSDGPFFFSKIHFLTSSLVVLNFTINSNGFLTILKFISWTTKFTSRSPILFWSFPRPFYACPSQHLSYVCGGFNKKIASKFTSIYQPRLRARLVGRLFLFFCKKVLVAPAPLTILTKPIVRLRCRCSCEMCRTSAVPLLVILETGLKSS